MTTTKKLLTLGVIAGIFVVLFIFLSGSIKGKSLGSSAIARNYTATGKFVTTWKTDNPETPSNKGYDESGSRGINIGASTYYTYNYTVDWGDGTTNTKVITNITHTYSEPGIYTVSISGIFPSFLCGRDAHKLLTVEEWGTNKWKTFEYAFANCENIQFNATDMPDLTNVTSMSGMFLGAKNFNSDISRWDVSKITNMSNMFSGATSFNQPLNTWNTSSVKNMKDMFGPGITLKEYLASWKPSVTETQDTSPVTTPTIPVKASPAKESSYSDVIYPVPVEVDSTPPPSLVLATPVETHSISAVITPPTVTPHPLMDSPTPVTTTTSTPTVVTTTPVTTSPILEIPSAPINVKETSQKRGQAVITFDTPKSNGGSPITDYIVEYKRNTDRQWQMFDDGISTNTTIVVTGLGGIYKFRVSAINAQGQSISSEIVQGTIF